MKKNGIGGYYFHPTLSEMLERKQGTSIFPCNPTPFLKNESAKSTENSGKTLVLNKKDGKGVESRVLFCNFHKFISLVA